MEQEASPFFNLDEIEEWCGVLELSVRREVDQIHVEVMPSVHLCFVNLQDEQDNLIGFDGTAWHTHGGLDVMTSANTSLSYAPAAVLDSLKTGELLIATEYSGKSLIDRWLVHKDYFEDGKWLDPGSELRYCRIP